MAFQRPGRKNSSYRNYQKKERSSPTPVAFDLYKEKMTADEFNTATETTFGKPRKKPVQWEHLEQIEVIAWVRNNMGTYTKLEMLYAVPNGGWRDMKTARHLKAEGCQPGLPDLCLPVAKGGFFGAHFELKTKADKLRGIKKGVVGEAQEWWLEKLKQEGYFTTVCYGAEETIQALKNYLSLPATQVI